MSRRARNAANSRVTAMMYRQLVASMMASMSRKPMTMQPQKEAAIAIVGVPWRERRPTTAGSAPASRVGQWRCY